MTVASACLDGSAVLVALIVSVVAPEGAVYTPVEFTDPDPECDNTLQVTDVFVEPVTAAVNWKVPLTVTI